VGEDHFDVGLAFNSIPERLHIPFKAVKVFMDPSVPFGLEFTADGEATRGTGGDRRAQAHAAMMKPAPAGKSLPPKPVPAKPPRPQPKKEAAPVTIASATPPSPSGAGKEDSTGEVVRLDRFRKK